MTALRPSTRLLCPLHAGSRGKDDRTLISENPETCQRAIAAGAKNQALGEFFKRAAGLGARAVFPIAVERAAAAIERRGRLA